ncbi:MAG: ribosomal protein S18-alanine N-acetyltransferase [Clostridiales bacterium]|jgi:ribosomal-protein-alanine N-acetyltransferase|nr:ribosomal protein S18-alanine N-acetyltransferase [Clostridiales bacterium]
MIALIPMTLDHLEEVFKVECECFTIPWTKSAFRKELTENQFGLYTVAVEDDRVLGYAGMWHVVTEGHITNIAVGEAARGRGIGDMLVKKLIAIAQEKEMMGITLEVNVNNLKAQRLYTKNGFVPEGIRKNYYNDTKEDAVIMWRYFSYDADTNPN